MRPAPGASATTPILVVPDEDAALIIRRAHALRGSPVASAAARPDLRRTAAASGGALVGVVQSAEDRDGEDMARVMPRWLWRHTRSRHAL